MAECPCRPRVLELQFVNGLPNSPKMEAKGVILVRGPWDQTSSSTGLPFDVNQICVRGRLSLTMCV